jgi:hypothetical protein
MKTNYILTIFCIFLVTSIPFTIADFSDYSFEEVDQCTVDCWEHIDGCDKERCEDILGCTMCDDVTCAETCLGDNRAQGETCNEDSQCDSNHCSGGKRATSFQKACCPTDIEWDYLKQTCVDENYMMVGPILNKESENGYVPVGFNYDDGSGKDNSEYYTLYSVVIPNNCDFGLCIDGDMNCDGYIDNICYASNEICNDNIDNDQDGFIDDGCCADANCEECGKGILNACDKSECESFGECDYDPGALIFFYDECVPTCREEIGISEICNGIDDNNNGYIDDNCYTTIEDQIIEQHICYTWEFYSNNACTVDCLECDHDEDDYQTEIELRYYSNPMDADDTPWNRMWQSGCYDYFEPEDHTSYDFLSNIGFDISDIINSFSLFGSPSPEDIGKRIGTVHGLIEGVWGDIVGLSELAGMLIELDLGDIQNAFSQIGELLDNFGEILDALIGETKNTWFDLRSETALDIQDYDTDCEDVTLTRSYTKWYSIGFMGAQILLFGVSWLKVTKATKLKIVSKFKGFGVSSGKGAKVFDVIDELTWLDELPEEIGQKVSKACGDIVEEYSEELATKIARTDIGKKAMQEWDDDYIKALAKAVDEYGDDLLTDLDELKDVTGVERVISNIANNPNSHGFVYEAEVAATLKRNGNEVVELGRTKTVEIIDPESGELISAPLEMDVLYKNTDGDLTSLTVVEVKNMDTLTISDRIRKQLLKLHEYTKEGNDAQVVISGTASKGVKDYIETNSLAIEVIEGGLK